MPTSGRNNGQLEGFRAAAQSLKLYRRADLVNESETSIVKDLSTLIRWVTSRLFARRRWSPPPQDSRNEESRLR